MAARPPDHLTYNLNMNKTIEYRKNGGNTEHEIDARGSQGSHPQFYQLRTGPCYAAAHCSPQRPRLSLPVKPGCFPQQAFMAAVMPLESLQLQSWTAHPTLGSWWSCGTGVMPLAILPAPPLSLT